MVSIAPFRFIARISDAAICWATAKPFMKTLWLAAERSMELKRADAI